MSVRDHGALLTWTSGDPTGSPVLLWHDRYRDRDPQDPLLPALASGHRVVAARSARTQMEMGAIRGYYWFLGPLHRPELSTLGDALSHAERLVLDIAATTGERVSLVGRGEGGTLALLVGLLWPDVVSAVVSIGGPAPHNLDRLPLTWPPADGLPVLLVGGAPADCELLAARGVYVDTAVGEETGIADWLTINGARTTA